MRHKRKVLIILSGGLILSFVFTALEFSLSRQVYAYPFETQSVLSLTAGDSPRDIVAGDFNGDNNIDLVVSSPFNGGKLSFLAGNGDGTFDVVEDTAAGGVGLPVSLDVGDFDNDGNLDVMVLQTVDSAALVALGDGAGNFSTSTVDSLSDTVSGIAVGDFNADDNDDVLISRSGGTASFVMISNGDDTFSTSTAQGFGNSQMILVEDFDNDTSLDYILVQSGVTYDFSLATGKGNGTFNAQSNITVTGIAVSTRGAVGDLDGDGNIDVILNDLNTDNVNVILGNGDETFDEPVVYENGTDVSGFLPPTDVDGDGDLDIIVHHNATDEVGVFLNDGNGVFEEDRKFSTGDGLTGKKGATGDFNDDGKTDFAVPNSSDDTVSVFLNDDGSLMITESEGTTVVEETANTDVISVRLSHVPLADVDVAIAGDTQASAVPALLTFTTGNWSSTQEVTLSAIDDEDDEGIHTGTITLTASSTDAFYDGLAQQTVSVTIKDNDVSPSGSSRLDSSSTDNTQPQTDIGSEEQQETGIATESVGGSDLGSVRGTAVAAVFGDDGHDEMDGTEFVYACTYFTEYLNSGEANVEVFKIQHFLARTGYYDGPLTGVVDAATRKAIITYQEAHSEAILLPWGITEGTGYWYKTSRKYANWLLDCDEPAIFLEDVNMTVDY